MNLGESRLERATNAKAEQVTNTKNNNHGSTLRESVSAALEVYLEQLDGQLGNDVYQMVLAEVEAPMLQAIMRYTRNNQTKASRMLGLNRGTLPVCGSSAPI